MPWLKWIQVIKWIPRRFDTGGQCMYAQICFEKWSVWYVHKDGSWKHMNKDMISTLQTANGKASWICIVNVNGNKARRNIITLARTISFSLCSSHLDTCWISLTEFPIPCPLLPHYGHLVLLSTEVYTPNPEVSTFSHGHRIWYSNPALPHNDETFFECSFPKRLQDSGSEWESCYAEQLWFWVCKSSFTAKQT